MTRTYSILAQLDIVKQDCGRVTAENNNLHVQLIEEAEKYEQLQKDSYQKIKKLEDKLAELSYWQQQAIGRYDVLEKDNAALRKRVAELLKMGEKRSKGTPCIPFITSPRHANS